MTSEDKALLIKDLSGRLPYGVYVEHIRTGMRGHLHDLKVYPLYDKTDDHIYDYICSTDFLGDGDYFDIEAFKPLLFPLSSMTEEMIEELNAYGFFKYRDTITNVSHLISNNGINEEIYTYIDIECVSFLIEFFNSHHIDYRGLIEKELAIDATNLNVY